MAADNERDGGDPIERAMRAKAQADESAEGIIDSVADDTTRGSILGSALERLDDRPAQSETVLFAAPKRTVDPSDSAPARSGQYVPEEKSFFSTSAEERVEQARRAAMRVRRRSVDGNDQKVSEQSRTDARLESAEKNSSDKVAKAKASLARLETLKRQGMPNDTEAKAPSSESVNSTNQTAANSASQPSSIMDRAIARKPEAEQKTEQKIDPVLAALKASEAQKAPAKKTAEDIIARSAERTNNQKNVPQNAAPEAKSDRLLDRIRAARVSKDSAKKPAESPKLDTAEKVMPSAKKPVDRVTTGTTGKVGGLPVPPADPSQSVEKQIEARKRSAKKDEKKVNPSAKRSQVSKQANPAREAVEPSISPMLGAEIPSVFGPAKKKQPSDLGKNSPSLKAPAPEPEVSPPKADNVEALTVEPVQDTSLYARDTSVIPTSGIKTAKTKAFAPFEWMIASRYLRARKKEGFVSVITGFSLVGIALGVATLIVVMAVMTGFRETLISQIIGGSPHINIVSQVGPFENFDEVADQVRTVEGVENVVPVVQGQVLGTGNDRHTGVLVRGMRKEDLEQLIERAEPEVVNGSLERFVEDDGVALGADLAAKLGLRVGDFITMISPDGDITPFSVDPLPRVKDYRIIQTFKLGVQEIDYNVAFMTFGEAQLYFNKQEQADTLDVFVADAENVEKYSEPIHTAARSSIGLYTWKRQNGRLIGAINLERQVMFVILTMIILVASLNIISGLVMLVKDKARDIAIMRTMGMARGSILRIFFICGSSIGVIGSFLGVILGVLFVWNIHAIQGFVEWVTGTSVWDPNVRAGIAEIPAKLQFSDVALTLFIALGLSFIATLFPAWKAAKLDPVEALRYE